MEALLEPKLFLNRTAEYSSVRPVTHRAPKSWDPPARESIGIRQKRIKLTKKQFHPLRTKYKTHWLLYCDKTSKADEIAVMFRYNSHYHSGK